MSVSRESLRHATCVAIGETGILIEGPPGSGKSDLALRLLDQPGFGYGTDLLNGRLIADDQVLIRRSGATLVASAPETISGRLEIRGLGIVSVAAVEAIPLGLMARLAPAETIERMPELEISAVEILGLSLPLVLIDPRQPSAPARLRAAAILLSGQSTRSKAAT
jgi:serine kinase of HPr protein (carbohydrate metabolism regulator)